MHLELDAEHVALREAARGFLQRHAPLPAQRDVDTDRLPELWHGIAGQGWLELGTATEDDLFGIAGAVLTGAELGRNAVPMPFAEHTAVSRMLATADEQHAAAWLSRLADGTTVCTLAALEERCDWSLVGLQAQAAWTGTGWHLTGRKTNVPFALTTGVAAVLANTPEGLGVFLVDRDDPGMTLVSERGFDRTRPSCAMTLDAVVEPDAAITGPTAEPAVHDALHVAAVVTASEAYGAADALLDIAVAFAKEREQFGRAIGSFQALQHIMADLHVLRETTWWTVLNAAIELDAGLDSAPHAARVAAAHTADATRSIGEGALQVLGGIGFSEEHDAHLLFGRILECEQRFGDAFTHQSALLCALVPS